MILLASVRDNQYNSQNTKTVANPDKLFAVIQTFLEHGGITGFNLDIEVKGLNNKKVAELDISNDELERFMRENENNHSKVKTILTEIAEDLYESFEGGHLQKLWYYNDKDIERWQ